MKNQTRPKNRPAKPKEVKEKVETYASIAVIIATNLPLVVDGLVKAYQMLFHH